MISSILLLDGVHHLQTKIVSLGFEATIGTIGFPTGHRLLQHQLYESDVIIYNPMTCAEAHTVTDHTPHCRIDTVFDHVSQGAIIVAFLNQVSKSVEQQRRLYGWLKIPANLEFSFDTKISKAPSLKVMPELLPVLTEHRPQTPIKLKLVDSDVGIMMDVMSQFNAEKAPRKDELFMNAQGGCLGAVYRNGKGFVIALPAYDDVAAVITTFLFRILPKVCQTKTRRTIADEFISPEQQAANTNTAAVLQRLKETENQYVSAISEVDRARRVKVRTIQADETAQRIIGYLEAARQQDDVALVYIYKIIDALGNKFGGKSEAIKALGCSTEWNTIAKLANASAADIRHAPKPGEKIRNRDPLELPLCFVAAQQIIQSYFSTLFATSIQIHARKPRNRGAGKPTVT